jgi:hypothetical protein
MMQDGPDVQKSRLKKEFYKRSPDEESTERSPNQGMETVLESVHDS